MTIGILGTGNVARALGQRITGAGLTARLGTRRAPDDAAAGTPLVPMSEVARGADMVLVAVPADAALDAVRTAAPAAGTVLVDCTNPLGWNAGPVWVPPAAGSGARAMAEAFPHLRVVKGFNHFGAEIQAQPMLVHGPADAFFAGDDDAAKAAVMDLAGRLGFRPRDAGPLRNAAVLENVAVLWIHMATVGGVGRTFALQIEPQG